MIVTEPSGSFIVLLIVCIFIVFLLGLWIACLADERADQDARIDELEEDNDELTETVRSAHSGIDRLEQAMAQSLTWHAGEASRTECCRQKLHHHFIDELRRFANVAGCIEKQLSEVITPDDTEAVE